jgi:para-aminobenzoate synthetase component 1
MDVNIAIRTMVMSRGEIRFWAGGGIIADSRVEDEYQETFDKASALLSVLQRSSAQFIRREP